VREAVSLKIQKYKGIGIYQVYRSQRYHTIEMVRSPEVLRSDLRGIGIAEVSCLPK
jgi:hypothetical protein